MGATRVSLKQNQVVEVNGVTIRHLPYEANGVKITRSKHNLQLESYIGVGLNWDGRSSLELLVIPAYRGRLYGMCGNFNGNKSDDLIPNPNHFESDRRTDLDTFAESWRIGTSYQCTPRPTKPKPIQSCQSLPILKQFDAHNACKAIKEHPEFVKCHPVVDPDFQHRSCLDDTCAKSCTNAEKCSCTALREYALNCALKGIKIHWSEHKHCSVKCPAKQEWVECPDKCQLCNRYWQNRNKQRTCSAKRCKPSCQCKNGLIKYRNRCIKPTACPLKYRLQGLPVEFYQGNWGRRKLKEIEKQLHISHKTGGRRNRSRKLGLGFS